MTANTRTIERTSRRIPIYFGILLVALGMFEVFSMSSNYTALMLIIGIKSWALFISYGLCIVDFAGLAKLLMPGEHDRAWGMLFAAWLITTIGDTFLTFYITAYSLQGQTDHILITSGVISLRFWIYGIPSAFSAFVWAIQYLLVTQFEKSFQHS